MLDVTVVITNWNYGDYLPEAVASIEAQTAPAAAWYIVDDGSTDEASLAFYEGMEPERVYYQGHQQGAAAAYQRGLDECRTEWIVYLDADDLLPADYLHETAACAAEHGASWVYTDFEWFWDSGKRELHSVRAFDAGSLKSGNFIHSAALVKADLLRQAGGWRDVPLEDWDLWKRVSELGVAAVKCPHTVLWYRRHTESRNFTGRGK